MMSKVFEAAVVAFGLIIGFCHWAESGTARAQAKRAEAGNAEEAIRSLTNRERIHRNLAPLKLDRACAQAIAGHVSEMAAGRQLSHQGRNGSSAGERYRHYNAKGRGAGENVAYNTYGTAQSFMRQWLRSPAHRANLLNPIYKGIGVAVRANCSGPRCYYYAGQCFSL